MQDLVKLSAGTIATLTALVLGLLVSSAKNSFDAINTGIVQGSARFILMDRAMAHHGSEMKAVTVFLSTDFVRVQVMWRQAPITAAIAIAATWTHHSELRAMEIGLRRIGEVILGSHVGVGVSWFMSKLWPVPERNHSHQSATSRQPSHGF